MKRLFIATLVLLAATFSFAQAPEPAFYTVTSDVYIGYVMSAPDFAGAPENLEGYEIAYTLNHGTRWGLTVSGSQAISFDAHNADQWQSTVGPKFNFLTGHFRPYATGQVGLSNQDSNELHPGDITQAKASSVNAFTIRLGGGADYQLSPHIYWRMGQWAVQLVPWGRRSSSLFQNFSSGFGFKF